MGDSNGSGNCHNDNEHSIDEPAIFDDPNFDYDCTWLIRIRGLPWTATKKEIVQFFDNVNILNGENGVHLITLSGNKSRPLGEAYIQLASENDFNKAQNFHRQTMGSRYIESEYLSVSVLFAYINLIVSCSFCSVFTAKFEDFKTILSKQLNLCHESVVRLRGLPWNATENDIADFFKGRFIRIFFFRFVRTFSVERQYCC